MNSKESHEKENTFSHMKMFATEHSAIGSKNAL